MSEKTENKFGSFKVYDILQSAVNTIKNDAIAMLIVYVFYTSIFVLISFLCVINSQFSHFLCALFFLIMTLSLISVLRSGFEKGILKVKSAFPCGSFIAKSVLLIVLSVLFVLLASLFISILSEFAKYFFLSVFGRLFTAKTVYFFAIAAIWSVLFFFLYLSFCMIIFSGKNDFSQSLSNALELFTENKLLFFVILLILSAAITFLCSSYIAPLFPLGTSKSAAAMLKALTALKTFCFSLKFALICSVAMPFYWLLLTAVYFTLGHEGQTKKVLEDKLYFGRDYSVEFASDNIEPGENDEPFESFSLSNAIVLSFGIYKKFFVKLTLAIAALYAVFICIYLSTVFILKQTGILTNIFPAKTLALQDIFFMSAGAFVLYYFLMFFFFSFVLGFFRGKGINFKNFYPGSTAVIQFFLFCVCMAAFIISIPFIIEKINLILQLSIKSFDFPFSAVAAPFVAFFTGIIIYAAVSLFYVPVLIMDGNAFSRSLTTCIEMMYGKKILFFCLLCGLIFVNLTAHASVIGWIFTVPFSALMLLQIYITISAGYSAGKYKCDNSLKNDDNSRNYDEDDDEKDDFDTEDK